MNGLRGKVALVTGGASGIGEATCELLAERGAVVAVTDVDAARGRAVAARLGAPHFFMGVDQADEAAWPGVLAELAERAGPVDLLFLNAGVMSRPAGAPYLDDPYQWTNRKALEKTVAVNMAGPMYAMLAAIPHMKGRGGTIIVTASGAGLRPNPNDPLYSATKAGVIFLVNSMAVTLAPMGIRAFTINPHGIDTPMCPPDLYQKKKEAGNFTSAREMAEAVLYCHEHAAPGEIWCGGHRRQAWRHAEADFIVAGHA